MPSLIFPVLPADGTTHDTGNGVTYVYSALLDAWDLDVSAVSGGSGLVDPSVGGWSGWIYSNGNIGSWPVGPTPNGYWEVVAFQNATTGSSNPGMVYQTPGTFGGGLGFALAGTPINMQHSGGAGETNGVVRGFWRQL